MEHAVSLLMHDRCHRSINGKCGRYTQQLMIKRAMQLHAIIEHAVPDCDKRQKLFLYIDATGSIIYENFCPLIVVLQMLVAAANPSSTSGTKISALLFPDNAKNKPPSPVFDVGTSCFDAVQGPSRSLSSLMIDFGVCLDHGRTGYDSTLFPSSCGEGTSAVKGLREIYDIASSTMSSTESAVLMLTDGIILDDAAERTKVLSDLKSVGINTVIAAGFNEADEDNLKLFTTSDNVLIGNDPIQFTIDIVNKMEEKDIICKYHGKFNNYCYYYTDSINQIQLTKSFKVSVMLICNCFLSSADVTEKSILLGTYVNANIPRVVVSVHAVHINPYHSQY